MAIDKDDIHGSVMWVGEDGSAASRVDLCVLGVGPVGPRSRRDGSVHKQGHPGRVGNLVNAWRIPAIRPDLPFRRRGCVVVDAVGAVPLLGRRGFRFGGGASHCGGDFSGIVSYGHVFKTQVGGELIGIGIAAGLAVVGPEAIVRHPVFMVGAPEGGGGV